MYDTLIRMIRDGYARKQLAPTVRVWYSPHALGEDETEGELMGVACPLFAGSPIDPEAWEDEDESGMSPADAARCWANRTFGFRWVMGFTGALDGRPMTLPAPAAEEAGARVAYAIRKEIFPRGT